LTDLSSDVEYYVQVVAVSGQYESYSEERQLILELDSEELLAGASSPWWIVILICIVVAIIVIIVIVCLVMKKRGPTRYQVKEPVPVNGASDVTKPVDAEKAMTSAPAPGSPPDTTAGGASSESLIDDDVDDDVASVEDPDVTNFNEDGSFIGMYSEQIGEEATAAAAVPNGRTSEQTRLLDGGDTTEKNAA
jgi:hypothetical protein